MGQGYAATGVNSAIFRHSSLVTHEDTQYAAFYDGSANMVLAKRKPGSKNWQTKVTPFRGKVVDVHNVVSLGVDGKGVLHISWDHHNNPLNYCRTREPGSLEVTERLTMTGTEQAVTYPQFYSLPDGDLLFVYRTGRSGAGDLLMNRYEVKTGKWTALPGPVVAGEKQRNAYWQMAVDPRNGAIHVSWCWRELEGNRDLITNHDICYARSEDGGRTWMRSTHEPYPGPITAHNAELAWRVPQRSNLANMTSMAVDSRGRPYIATFWRPKDDMTEQLYLVFHDGEEWQLRRIGHRTSHPLVVGEKGGFTLSRPLIVIGRDDSVHVVFRDAARSSRITIATNLDRPLQAWKLQDVTSQSVDDWEPTHDSNLWNRDHVLHLLVQKCLVGYPRPASPEPDPEPVRVLQWRFDPYQR
jgi:hypothetical protein